MRIARAIITGTPEDFWLRISVFGARQLVVPMGIVPLVTMRKMSMVPRAVSNVLLMTMNAVIAEMMVYGSCLSTSCQGAKDSDCSQDFQHTRRPTNIGEGIRPRATDAAAKLGLSVQRSELRNKIYLTG